MEARRAPALAALPGLRSEDLFVEGPPGAHERAGRPSPTLADLVRICARAHFSTLAALPRKGPTLVVLPPWEQTGFRFTITFTVHSDEY